MAAQGSSGCQSCSAGAAVQVPACNCARDDYNSRGFETQYQDNGKKGRHASLNYFVSTYSPLERHHASYTWAAHLFDCFDLRRPGCGAGEVRELLQVQPHVQLHRPTDRDAGAGREQNHPHFVIQSGRAEPHHSLSQPRRQCVSELRRLDRSGWTSGNQAARRLDVGGQ